MENTYIQKRWPISHWESKKEKEQMHFLWDDEMLNGNMVLKSQPFSS